MSKPKKKTRKQVSKAAPTRMDRIFGPISVENFQGRLELVHDIIMTVVLALEGENAVHGPDIARVLKFFAANELWAIILKMRGEKDE